MPLGAQVIMFCLGVGVEQFVNLPMIVVAGLSTLLKSQKLHRLTAGCVNGDLIRDFQVVRRFD